MKAIKIDAIKKEFSFVELEEGNIVASILKHLDCEGFSQVEVNETNACIVTDIIDKGVHQGYNLTDYDLPFYGNGLISGVGPHGESIDTDMTIEQAKEIVNFVEITA